MHGSGWKIATLDYDRATTEFTGDDVDQFTDLVDLGAEYKELSILIPPLSASGTVSVYIQKNEAIATIPYAVHDFLDSDADNTVLQASTSGDGSIAVIFKIGGARYIRVRANANQSANRTFYVKGLDLVMPAVAS